MTVSGGNITLTAEDDGINAAGGTDSSGTGGMIGGDRLGGGKYPGGHEGGASGAGGTGSDGSILISGGTVSITAYGDGIDANGTLEISGGFITVCGPTVGDTATLDYDIFGVITGGTFIGTGANNMAQTFSDSEQGVIALTVGFQSAGTEILLTDSDGSVVVRCTSPLNYGVVIISTPLMAKGGAYHIRIGSAEGDFTAY